MQPGDIDFSNLTAAERIQLAEDLWDVPAELLSQLLIAMDDPEPAPNLRLGRVSLSSAYLTARKEGRFSNSPWRPVPDLLSTCLATRPGQGSVKEAGGIVW